jgi:hypothetical protein
MKHNIDIAVKYRERNLASIRKQQQHYSDEIKQIRVKINSHLDTIEQRIMGDLIDVEENVKLQIENLLTELSKRSDTINEIQGTILALKEYSSDLQTFLGSKVNNILPLGQITHPLLLCDISFGILIFEYTVNLISLIECKDGGSTTDIICACLLFFVLRTALCEPVSMATDPNVVIVDTKSKMLLSMLHLILSCFRLPSSDKDSTNFSCFSTSTSIDRTEDYGRID